MPKKHRVKRANYVQHLLKMEREREEYLDRRLKRNRQTRNEEDPMAEAREVMEGAARAKKQRREEREEEEEENIAQLKSETPVASSRKASQAVKKQETEDEKDAREMAETAAAAAEVAAVASKGFFSASSTAGNPFAASAAKREASEANNEPADVSSSRGGATAPASRKAIRKRY